MSISLRKRIRPHDWASAAMLCMFVLAAIGLFRGNGAWFVFAFAATVGLGLTARRFSRGTPGPMPHALRWVLFLPRGTHSPAHLRRILAPRVGERVLELGPGIGVHAIPIAEALGPGGTLDAVDAQSEMLADLDRRAARAGISNIVTKQGDAQHLPYADNRFDAAYLVGVLGEIPDIHGALCELRRVLKPDGRLVVGEMILDPDYLSGASLSRMAEEAGFVFEIRQGPWLAYFSRFATSAKCRS